MILLTSLYDSGNEKRNAELRECLKKNIANPIFSQIVLFTENGFKPGLDYMPSEWGQILKPAFLVGRVSILTDGFERRVFNGFFEYANRWMGSVVFCVANADIAFDITIGLLTEKHFDNRFMCLSRWVKKSDGSVGLDAGAGYTQDAWAFKTPVKIPDNCNFPLGQRGCDNKIAWLMDSIGYKLFNPAYTIKALHVHDSGFRTYTDKSEPVPGPYKQVTPTELTF